MPHAHIAHLYAMLLRLHQIAWHLMYRHAQCKLRLGSNAAFSPEVQR